MKDLSQSLYRLFERHLHKLEIEDQPEMDFIDSVVTDYLQDLGKQGHFSDFKSRDFLVEEIKDEVNCMLKKKIYGHFNLNDYRRNQRKKDLSS